MLDAIGIRNLRSFKETTIVNLKPITVFVGKNSSGKSSFLRTLPLLRQSVESNTTGPILWFGRYVDFGEFSEVISNDTKDNTISFIFKYKSALDRNATIRFKDEVKNEITLNLTVTAQKQKTTIDNLEININDSNIKINIINNSSSGIAQAHLNIDNLINEDLHIAKNDSFIPLLLIQNKKEDASNNSRNKIFSSFYDYYHDNLEKHFLDEATKILKVFFHSKTDETKIKSTLARVPVTSVERVNIILNGLFKEQKTFIKNLNKNNNEIVKKLYPYVIAWNLTSIIRSINNELSHIFTGVKYIAPLRATAERYYRFQDLQVNEIDHTGSNLAMLINSLKPSEQKEFSAWTRENFGFSVFVREVGNHYAVKLLTNNESKEYNISDMGFGYSQVLPIITSIWFETVRKRTSQQRPLIFVIEQPELHLHPAYQAKIGELFAKVISHAKDNSIPLKIIFETHSQSIIDALGEKIENNNLSISKDDISILVFNKNNDGITDVSLSYFDNDGFLNDWPIGFFSGR
ncbi:AAA family ATPase [Tolumonas osonensis]|uniref:Putative ATPase n=1 Tax=Tolumonas osonensis TaxID=675874 RepID=A0A841GL86_9GAMM|nr:AAA family ATPase [Tolumonas osonensis]MBB6055921.1 putative ATPase [Tolumonas osonensis]